MTVSKQNGKYYCRFQLNGIQYNRACKDCNTLKEAKQYENDLIYNITHQITIKEKSTSLGKLMECFLDYSRLNKKSWKLDEYRSKLILDYFNKYTNIEAIKPVNIEQFKLFLLDEGKSKTTANRYLEILSKMFNIAIDNEWLNKNPIKKNTKFKSKNYTVRYLTKYEERKLFKYLDDELKIIVTIALNTGLRLDNILKLKWSNINFEFEFIEILENKSNKHIRLHMNSKLVNMLKKLDSTNTYLFINPRTNKPYNSIRRRWLTACKKANIENLRFHDLRHTVATRLLKKKIPITIVKEILGHSDISTTMRYLHFANEEVRSALNRL